MTSRKSCASSDMNFFFKVMPYTWCLLDLLDRCIERLQALQNRAVAPKSASDMKMAAAVAEATTAAAGKHQYPLQLTGH